MCGIIGFVSTEARGSCPIMGNVARELLVLDSLRGFDSTGVITSKYNADPTYHKEAISGACFVDRHYRFRYDRPFGSLRFMIGHNRAATIGAVTDELAHPFSYTKVAGVHNGTISGWDSDWIEYLPALAKKDKGGFASDSQALYAVLDTLETDEEITKFLGSISRGAYALVWYDSSIESVRFARNDERPLHLAKVAGPRGGKKGWVYASEANMLEYVVSRADDALTYEIETFMLEEHTLFTVPVGSTGGKATAVKYEQEKPVYFPKRKYVPSQYTPAQYAGDDFLWDAPIVGGN